MPLSSTTIKRVTNKTIRVHGSEELLRRLRRALTFIDTQAPTYGAQRKVRVMLSPDGKARVGLLRPLKKLIRKITGRWPVDETGWKPPKWDFDNSPVGLRDYQETALAQFKRFDRCVFVAATNAGKTHLMAALCAAYPDKDKKIIVLVNRKQLAVQLREDLENILRVPVAFVGASHDAAPGWQIIVCMERTLRNKMRDLFSPSSVGLILYDECQHLSKTGAAILSRFDSANVYGFTGTMPCKEREAIKRWRIISFLGTVLDSKITNSFLIEQGHSAQISVMMCKVTDPPSRPYIRGDPRYKWSIVEHGGRNATAAKIAALCAPDCVIAANHTSHCALIAVELEKLGVPFVQIDGRDSLKVREVALADFVAHKVGVLLTTTILDQGLNIPTLRTIINVSGGPSLIRLFQRLGRGARKKEGYNYFLFVDFDDLYDRKTRSNSKLRKEALAREFEIIEMQLK